MPLFNPSSKSVTKLELIEQVSATRGSSDGASIISSADSNKVFTTITNRGSFDAYVGFELDTGPTNYVAKILPGGTYETPLGVFEDVYYWSKANQGHTVASFTAV